MSTVPSIYDLIKTDHADILKAYENYLSAEGNLQEQKRWAHEFRWELARHSIAEELVVYPAIEKYLPFEGEQIAHQDRAEHQHLKEWLHKLETTSVSDPNYRPIFDKLISLLKTHIIEEEGNDYPKLEQVLTNEQNESVARSYKRTKMFVPTRSHPNAPNKPPFETVVGLLTAPIDKLRDMFQQFPDDK